jgi:DNA-directed RNA polymerase subunit RPC12/RpoP
MPVHRRRRLEKMNRRRADRQSGSDREREAIQSRLGAIQAGLTSASMMINKVESNLNYIDGQIAILPARLSKIRGQGYECLSYLEKNQDLLASKWIELGPQLKQDFQESIQPLRSEVNRLQSEASRLRSAQYRNKDRIGSSTSALSLMVSTLRTRTASETGKFHTSLEDFRKNVTAIDEDLRIGESTVEWFSQASFPLKEGESPVLALKAKMMKKDKEDGTLYFTNQRFIFEGVKEVVLKRTLFIATKKKKVRAVIMDQPIGIIQEISEGRVGLLAWAGIYVHFKPNTGMEEASFDVKGEEIPIITKLFNYIISGEADTDIATVRGIAGKTSEPQVKILRCPTCGAPYTREIYRGQTSVQCKYCGSAISVKG